MDTRTVSLDRVHGMLVGHSLGDALGAPFESLSCGRKKADMPEYRGLLEYTLDRYDRYRKTWKHFPVGIFTDDSGMTLVCIDRILDGYDKEEAILNYMEWANCDKYAPTGIFVGKNTRALLKNPYKRFGTKRYHEAYQKIFLDTDENTWTQSNGSLMRCCGFAVAGDGNQKVVSVDCSITNPHPVNLEANRLYVTALHLALCGYSRKDIWTRVNQDVTLDEVKHMLEHINKHKPYPIQSRVHKGYVLAALYCALRVLVDEESTYRSVVDALAALPDSDTDTNAAIAGALIGALEGYTKMMEDDVTVKNSVILQETNNVDYKRIARKLMK